MTQCLRAIHRTGQCTMNSYDYELLIISFMFFFTVNNTLNEAEKDKVKEKGKETDIYSNKDKSKEKEEENTTSENESVAGKDVNTEQENTTAVDGEDKYNGTTPGKTVVEGRNEGEVDERNTGPEKPSGGGEDKVTSESPDNSLDYMVEEKEPKQPEKKEDTNFDKGKTDVTEVPVTKDKGQEESERKEKQVNGKRDPDKVGPNDTKLRTVISEGENTVEMPELEMTKNNTVSHDTESTSKENNTIGRKIIPTRVNITLYRAESGKPKEKSTTAKDEKEKDSTEKTKEVEREKKEKEKDREREDNQSFTGKGTNDDTMNN